MSVDIREDNILQKTLKIHLNYTKYVINFHLREDFLIIATKYSIKILYTVVHIIEELSPLFNHLKPKARRRFSFGSISLDEHNVNSVHLL